MFAVRLCPNCAQKLPQDDTCACSIVLQPRFISASIEGAYVIKSRTCDTCQNAGFCLEGLVGLIPGAGSTPVSGTMLVQEGQALMTIECLPFLLAAHLPKLRLCPNCAQNLPCLARQRCGIVWQEMMRAVDRSASFARTVRNTDSLGPAWGSRTWPLRSSVTRTLAGSSASLPAKQRASLSAEGPLRQVSGP